MFLNFDLLDNIYDYLYPFDIFISSNIPFNSDFIFYWRKEKEIFNHWDGLFVIIEFDFKVYKNKMVYDKINYYKITNKIKIDCYEELSKRTSVRKLNKKHNSYQCKLCS